MHATLWTPKRSHHRPLVPAWAACKAEVDRRKAELDKVSTTTLVMKEGPARPTFVAVRVGLRPATTSGLPIIGRSAVHPAVVYATGHFRNGILLAPLTAKLVASLITDH